MNWAGTQLIHIHGVFQRGGQGNVHLDDATRKAKEVEKRAKGPAHEGWADKLKYKLFGRK